jgi:hypothetical protein
MEKISSKMRLFGQAVKLNIGNIDRGFLALLFTIREVLGATFRIVCPTILSSHRRSRAATW